MLGNSYMEWNQGEVQKRNRLVNKNGLVANHAYTIFDTARVQNKHNRKVDLLRILSPHSDRSKISKCKSYWVVVKVDGSWEKCCGLIWITTTLSQTIIYFISGVLRSGPSTFQHKSSSWPDSYVQDNRWNGHWSHDCSKWDSLDPTVESRLPHGGESGDFWMSKDDWVKQFESMTICLMPDFFTNYHQREVLHHILYIRVHSNPLPQV